MGGHSGDNSCGISNKKARVCGLWDAPPIVVVDDWRLAADQLNTVCVCVCWHAGPTPHSLLQNLHLCVLPGVSLPASLLLLLQIRRCRPSKQWGTFYAENSKQQTVYRPDSTVFLYATALVVQ